jgi:carboxypeptidase PM20D1
MLKRLFLALCLVVVAVLIVMVVRAEHLRPAPIAAVAAPAPLPIDQAGAIARFAAAIRIPTESREDLTINQDAIAKLRDLLQASFPRVHAAMTREVLPSGAMILTWKGRDPSLDPVVLMGHMDVVPADPTTLARWQHPPYSGDIAGGAVWGRGTLDDKSAVLSLLEAAETLLAQGFTPARTVILAFGDDEENGGHQGANNIVKLLQSRGVHAEFVVDEGGAVIKGILPGMDRPVALIGISEKGYVDVSLSTTALGGHSSEPPAHTAIGELAAGLSRLESHPFPGSLPKPVESQLTSFAPYLPFSKRLILANLWLTRPLVIAAGLKDPGMAGGYHTTTAEDIISGGIKANVLPTNAHAIVNFRILPGDTVDSVVDGVRQRVADPGITVANANPAWSHNPSPVSPTDTPGYATLTGTIRQFFPSAVVTPYMVQAATDSSYYYAISPNVYRFSPIEGSMAMMGMVHGFNERMTIANYIHAVQFEAQLLQNIR